MQPPASIVINSKRQIVFFIMMVLLIPSQNVIYRILKFRTYCSKITQTYIIIMDLYHNMLFKDKFTEVCSKIYYSCSKSRVKRTDIHRLIF